MVIEPYFWLQTVERRTSNLIGLSLDLLNYSSNSSRLLRLDFLSKFTCCNFILMNQVDNFQKMPKLRHISIIFCSADNAVFWKSAITITISEFHFNYSSNHNYHATFITKKMGSWNLRIWSCSKITWHCTSWQYW